MTMCLLHFPSYTIIISIVRIALKVIHKYCVLLGWRIQGPDKLDINLSHPLFSHRGNFFIYCEYGIGFC